MRELSVMKQAAREAGTILLEMQGKIVAREKGPADLVTEADVAAQHCIQRVLEAEFPDYGFLGEESDSAGGTVSESCRWVVDPIDGTTNYVHGFDNYSVSIALQQEAVVAGVIFDPVHNRMYSASLGGGAFLNDVPIRTSDVGSLDKALVAASFPPGVQREAVEVKHFVEVLVKCQALRRLGSAALNLCYVAEGKLDAYWATSLKIWDAAAGLLIVTEAGGSMSNIEGGPVNLAKPRLIVASTDSLLKEMVDTLALVTE